MASWFQSLRDSFDGCLNAGAKRVQITRTNSPAPAEPKMVTQSFRDTGTSVSYENFALRLVFLSPASSAGVRSPQQTDTPINHIMENLNWDVELSPGMIIPCKLREAQVL